MREAHLPEHECRGRDSNPEGASAPGDFKASFETDTPRPTLSGLSRNAVTPPPNTHRKTHSLTELPGRRVDFRSGDALPSFALTSLRTAEEVSDSVLVPPERLNGLAEAGYAPHYRIDGGPPLFRPQEIKAWVRENLLERWEPNDVPWQVSVVRIVAAVAEGLQAPPPSISSISGLASIGSVDIPGVYFLCLGDRVVYIGQSIGPYSRIGHHARDRRKDFDRAYLLPVPRELLDEVEAAFIRALKPDLNTKAPVGPKNDAKHLARYLPTTNRDLT